MKKQNILTLCCALIAITLVSYFIIQATVPKIGYVKNQQLFTNFEGTKELKIKLDGLQQRQQSILDSMELELTLLNNGKELDRKVFESKKQFFFQLKQEFIEEADKQTNEFTSQIWNQINQYLTEYGKENGYEYIFGATGNGSLMYAETKEDLTEKVLLYINEKYAGN